MQLRVECYAGTRAEERPQRFFLRERRFEVQEVLDQWYGPHDFFVRVRADDGNIYILRHNTDPNHDLWTLESFRRAVGE
jgi:hypothetical protein